MKKINSIVSILASILCIDHFVCMSLLMIGVVKWNSNLVITGRIIFSYLVLHAIYGMVVGIGNSRRNKKANGNTYIKENKSYHLQMMSGMVLLALATAHVILIQKFVYTPNVWGLTILILFTLLVCIHMVIGFPKAMITLGLLTKHMTYRVYWFVGLIIFTVIGIFTVISSVLFYMGGGIG